MFCFTVRTHFLPQPDVLQNEETITGPQVSAADTSPSLTEMTFSGPTRGMTVISDVLTCTTLFSVRLRQQQSTAEANGPRFTESTPGCRSTVHPGNSYDRNGSSCGSSFVFRPVLARSLSLGNLGGNKLSPLGGEIYDHCARMDPSSSLVGTDSNI